MTDVAAAGSGSDMRQRQDFGRRGVNAGLVFKTRRKTERATFEFAGKHIGHNGNFFPGCRATKILAKYFGTETVVPDIRRHIDGCRRCFQFCEKLTQGVGRSTILADDDCRNALADDDQCVRVIKDAAIGVTVRIDEAR